MRGGNTARLRSHGRPPQRSGQAGYAMLLALAMMAAMIIASTVVMTNMRTEGQRQREREMVWRGKQYVTAIKRFYRRSGHYPQDPDELEKGVANIHFLRQAVLKDPMNGDEDGKWRFIYTNASGQIIGSVHYATMQQMAILDLNGGKIPNLGGSAADSSDNPSLANGANGGPATGDNASTAASSSSNQDSTSTASCPPAGNSNQLASAQNGSGPGGLSPTSGYGSGIGSGVVGMTSSGGAFSLQSAVPQFGSSETQDQPASGSSTTCPQGAQLAGMMGMPPAALQALLGMKPTGPVDSPVIGGFLIGVGSTVDHKSVRIYKGGKKYSDWEFIWNPLEEQALAMQQAMGQSGAPGGVAGGLPGGIQPIGIATSSAGLAQTPPNDQQQPPQ